MTVTGPGSIWSNSSGVNIGNLGTGTLTIADSGLVTGPIVIATNAGSTGTLNIGAGAGNPAAAPGTLTAPSVAFGAGTGTLNFNHTSTNYVFAPAISGNGSVNVLAGVTTLTANNTYTGATTVNGGALIVNGSIASSSLTTVNSGAALLGSGTVGTTQVNAGGFLVPGPVGTPGTMTVSGNLAFQSGAFYFVQVNPTTASTTNVSGTASLAAPWGQSSRRALYRAQLHHFDGRWRAHRHVQRSRHLRLAGRLPGEPELYRQYRIAQPHGPACSRTYAANANAANANAIATRTGAAVAGLACRRRCRPSPSTSSTSAMPSTTSSTMEARCRRPSCRSSTSPATISPLRWTSFPAKPPPAAQKVAFQLTDQFLNLMLDPFVDGRSGVGGADHPALGFAPERDNTPPEIALAYASVLKGPRVPAPLYEPRWTVWGGAYGGSNRTTGDVALIGSHDLSARTVGFAGGFDYRLTPDTVVGLAFAGGGTNWSLSQGLGGGKSDAFQAGIYGATKYGPAYLAAAFAFANHWMSTDRLAVGDHLTANFDAQSYGGRLEGGYRFATPYLGITPYAAIQAQSFHTPGYTETGADPQRLCAHFQWPRRHRYQERVGRALRPGAGGLFKCGVGAARARRVGARLGQRPDADATVPGASRLELHRQRRAPAAERRAGVGRRGASLRQRDHVTRQVRRRVRLALIDLRGNGDVPIQVVRAVTRPCLLALGENRHPISSSNFCRIACLKLSKPIDSMSTCPSPPTTLLR